MVSLTTWNGVLQIVGLHLNEAAKKIDKNHPELKQDEFILILLDIVIWFAIKYGISEEILVKSLTKFYSVRQSGENGDKEMESK